MLCTTPACTHRNARPPPQDQVDKDVAVAKEHFGLSASYSTMSPLVLHKGYTKRFLDGKVRRPAQPAAVLAMP